MGLTEELGAFAASLQYDSLPSPVVHEAKRSILDFFAVAFSGSHHEALELVASVLLEMGGKETTTVIGRGTRTSALYAAMLNGQAANLLDYDDTHLDTLTHISAPITPPILALSESQRIDGKEFIAAFVAGFEVTARLGLAVWPAHYGIGWHATGTLGTVGAAASASRILGLNAEQTTHALSVSSTQAAGFRDLFGTMGKTLHAGKAAMGGLLSALLAQKGFTGSPRSLEAPRGFAYVLSAERDLTKAIAGIGSEWELAKNSHKPYACGVVSHPFIDAAIQIRNEDHIRPEQVERILVRVNPIVLELMGKKNLTAGLEGKFSVYHCSAVGLIAGMAGPAQYTDARVNDPAVAALRRRVTAEVDTSLREDEGWMSLVTVDGREIVKHVAHASGSRDNPLSDATLTAKLHSMADELIGVTQANQLVDAIWHLDELGNAGSLAALAAGIDRAR